jgi:hypothetical protein
MSPDHHSFTVSMLQGVLNTPFLKVVTPLSWIIESDEIFPWMLCIQAVITGWTPRHSRKKALSEIEPADGPLTHLYRKDLLLSQFALRLILIIVDTICGNTVGVKNDKEKQHQLGVKYIDGYVTPIICPYCSIEIHDDNVELGYFLVLTIDDGTECVKVAASHTALNVRLH